MPRASGARRAGRIERQIGPPPRIEERQRDRADRGEVHLVPLVDDPAGGEGRHRPAGQDPAHREVRPQDDRAFGGWIDVHPGQKAAREALDGQVLLVTEYPTFLKAAEGWDYARPQKIAERLRPCGPHPEREQDERAEDSGSHASILARSPSS